MTEDRPTPPATPSEFGEKLQRLRENAGLEREDIARETKISLRVLRGLEEGRFQWLPDLVFARNFVRQVADAVGGDGDELVELFERAWRRHRVTSGTNPVLTLETPSGLPVVKTWVWIPLGSAVVIVIAVALAVVLLRSRQAERPLSGEHWAPGATPASVTRVRPVRPSPGPTVQPSPTPQQVTDGEDRRVAVEVRILPDRECWVRSRDADGRVSRQLLYGGESVVLESQDRLELTVGDASAVALKIDGELLEDLGAPGQVRHFEVTPAGIEALGGWRSDDQRRE